MPQILVVELVLKTFQNKKGVCLMKNKTKVKKLALTLAMAQVFSVLPALPISNIAGLNNGSMVYAARTEYTWKKYNIKSKKIKIASDRRVEELAFGGEGFCYSDYKIEGDKFVGAGDRKQFDNLDYIETNPYVLGSMNESGDITQIIGEAPMRNLIYIKSARQEYYKFFIVDVYSVDPNSKGDIYMGIETSSNRNTYPDNGEKDGYYYEYTGTTTLYDADSFSPSTKTLSCKRNEKVDLKTGLTNAPSGTTVTVTKDVDTTTAVSYTHLTLPTTPYV